MIKGKSIWDSVKNLENLSSLNSRLAMEELDEAIKSLQECRQRLEEAQLSIREMKETVDGK